MFAPPCGSGRNLSWGYAALRGHKLGNLGRLWVSVRPVRRSSPVGLSAASPSASRSRQKALHVLSLPFRGRPAEAPHRHHTFPRPQGPASRAGAGASSHGLLSPYGTCRGGESRTRQRIPPPTLAACEVWVPPSRLIHRACRHDKSCRSAHGFHSPRVSPRRDRPTFRWPYPHDVAAYSPLPPKGEGRHMAAFKASLPRRVRSAPKRTKHESRIASAVDPFLRFFPSRVLLPLDQAHALAQSLPSHPSSG